MLSTTHGHTSSTGSRLNMVISPGAGTGKNRKGDCTEQNQWLCPTQGGSDGSGRHSSAPMLTAIMSGGVGISGRELSLSC